MRAGQERHEAADKIARGMGGCDKRQIDREHHDHDARDEHEVREEGQEGSVFNHFASALQYWTLRSTKRNCTTVSAITISIRMTDCAADEPMFRLSTPSV